MRMKWDDDKNKRLVDLVNQGLSNAQIAERFNSSIKAIGRQLTNLRKTESMHPRKHTPILVPVYRFKPTYDNEEKQAEADAAACDQHLVDLRRAHPKGPPPDVVLRPTSYARRSISLTELSMM
jgi:hypothetical protein